MSAANSRVMHIILTIDTEGDNYWAGGDSQLSFRNIERLPEFQEFCEGLGLKPTYLVAYEVIADDRAREVIQELAKHGNCEIGAHLHAWLTPPFYPPLEPPGKNPYLHEYPEELRQAKVETTTKAIQEAIGERPKSYRGGRWSIDTFTMRTLDDMGYVVDTTVTPFVSWVRTRGTTSGGPNFTMAPHRPYHPDAHDPVKPGELAILEVPPSHRPRNVLPYSLYKAIGRRMGGHPETWRLTQWFFLNRLGKVVYPNPAKTVAEALQWLVRRLLVEGTDYVNLAFHSSELVAGCAPWVWDATDELAIRERLESLVEYVASLIAWKPATLIEFRAAFDAGQSKAHAG